MLLESDDDEAANARFLYDRVAVRHEPIGRDDAPAALGISHELATFCLDRLNETVFFRTTGRASSSTPLRSCERSGVEAGSERFRDLREESEQDVSELWLHAGPRQHGKPEINITYEDVKRAADANAMTVDATMTMIARTSDKDRGDHPTEYPAPEPTL